MGPLQKNLQYNNFRNFRNCDLFENLIVLCFDCDRHFQNWIRKSFSLQSFAPLLGTLRTSRVQPVDEIPGLSVEFQFKHISTVNDGDFTRGNENDSSALFEVDMTHLTFLNPC